MNFLGQVALHKPALHAGVPATQQRPVLIVDNAAGRAGRHGGEAERAALDIERNGAERRAFRAPRVSTARAGMMQFG